MSAWSWTCLNRAESLSLAGRWTEYLLGLLSALKVKVQIKFGGEESSGSDRVYCIEGQRDKLFGWGSYYYPGRHIYWGLPVAMVTIF